ncbi:OstA-like protein [Botryobacter ruber]|uniref:OstA-like protein n=1 Tax=Botryobacter ruber TaxID=2171629 RepID=UPI000E0BF65D|nr:OstA-like protein [Botryobacter ruber]
MKITKLLFSVVFTFISFAVLGQQTQKSRVELQGADSLVGGVTYNGEKITKLLGNVKFKQQDMTLFADSVYRYVDRQVLEAFGQVRMNQADTVTITGSRATYDSDKRQANISGGVVMQDPKMTLTTPTLDYNLDTKVATYTEGGTIVDPENQLQSQWGAYDTNTKIFTFRQNVKVTTADYTITAQNMRYNTESKIVYFAGPTFIKGQQGDLYAEEGTYDTIKKISRFGRNAYILTPEYRLGGDQLYYDQNRGYGFAQRNVTLRSLKDDVTIHGQTGRYWRGRGLAKVYGSPVMETILDGDTLYLAADTLISRESQVPEMPSMLFAFPNVKIFKKDLQGACDSLSYNRTDSIMHMNRKPILWSDASQLVSDTIHIQLRNKTIDRMYMYSNAFIASEDSLKNYNQVKGRDMVAYFQEGNIRRVNVNGNGESLYFVLEGDTAVTGMNKAICSDMVLKFAEKELKSISFLVNPDASLIPPHELKEEEKTLEGFNWMGELRPQRKDIFAKRVPAAKPKKQTKPAARPATKPKKPAATSKKTAAAAKPAAKPATATLKKPAAAPTKPTAPGSGFKKAPDR